MALERFILERQHIDSLTDSRLQLLHNGDYVVLTGPVTVSVNQYHRQSPYAALICEPQHRFHLRPGQRKRIVNEEYTPDYPGDWDTEIVLLNEP